MLSPDLEAIRRIVAVSRAEQGLPPVIEDDAVLNRVASLFARETSGAGPATDPAAATTNTRAHLEDSHARKQRTTGSAA